jgi:hypothetical protein
MERVSALEVQLRVYGNSLGILRRGTGRELSEMVLDRRDGNAGALWMNHKQEVCKAGLNICEVESGERNPPIVLRRGLDFVSKNTNRVFKFFFRETPSGTLFRMRKRHKVLSTPILFLALY